MTTSSGTRKMRVRLRELGRFMEAAEAFAKV
jgi:hypothetical protein